MTILRLLSAFLTLSVAFPSAALASTAMDELIYRAPELTDDSRWVDDNPHADPNAYLRYFDGSGGTNWGGGPNGETVFQLLGKPIMGEQSGSYGNPFVASQEDLNTYRELRTNRFLNDGSSSDMIVSPYASPYSND